MGVLKLFAAAFLSFCLVLAGYVYAPAPSPVRAKPVDPALEREKRSQAGYGRSSGVEQRVARELEPLPKKEASAARREDQPAVTNAPPPIAPWTAAGFEEGRKECDARLAGIGAIFERLGPISEGVCGAPAPIKLRGFEQQGQPALLISPEPVMTCRLAQTLSGWLRDVVQPAAELYLHSRIVKLTNMSDYSCRMQYTRGGPKVSEHAVANAIDIGEFITADGKRVSVIDGWKAGGEQANFLHAVHDGACQLFGTTLGPDANADHANHFHLDERQRRHPICNFTPEQVRARGEAQKLAAQQNSQGKSNGQEAGTRR